MVFQVSIRSSAESFEDRLKDIQTSRNALVDIATKQNWQLKMDQVVVVSEGYRKFSSSRAALGDLDANSTPLLLVPLAEQKDTVALVRRIRLIAEHQSVPKKLQVTVENFRVGLEDPEKFRPEILRQVRQHIDATAAALGPNIDLECTGLDEPIMAQQIEERVVEVSLPFHVTYSRKSK